MSKVACDGGRVRQQRYATSGQRLAQLGLFNESVNAKFHGVPLSKETVSAKASGWWKSGFPGGCRNAQ